MLSKQTIKWVSSLALKKFRDREHVFLAEGPKLVGELLAAGFTCPFIAQTSEFSLPSMTEGERFVVSEDELKRLSQMKAPQGVVAVFRQPDDQPPPLPSEPTLLLDAVQDPGNVGTIIRLADWFGIEHIVLGHGCADPWGGKCVQATMGAIARVRVHTNIDAASYAKSVRQQGLSVQGCVLTGDDIYSAPLPPNGLIVLGNEGQGISPAVEAELTHRVTIPSFPPERPTSESLNVAIATAIVCAELRRRQQ